MDALGFGLDGVDLTSFDTMTISGLGSTAAGGTVSVWFNFFDAELAPITGAFQVANLATGPIGSVSFDLRSLQFEETSVVNNLSNINFLLKELRTLGIEPWPTGREA